MMTLVGTKTALAPGLTASFGASGGTAPYTYSVVAGGAGGTINSTTGLYHAPVAAPADPAKGSDTILATDSVAATATASILVGLPLILFCEILQRELGLAPGRVFLWDQKIFQPSDADLYIAVGIEDGRAFGNNVRPDPVLGWSNPIYGVNMLARLGVNLLSRGPGARDRKEEVLLALGGLYSRAQQEGNNFYIGRLPPGGRFFNLSMVDGAAIPYRFMLPVHIQYSSTKTPSADYFNTFQATPVTLEA